jgi:enoyl-CoA hydratase/carnithine racemase
MSEPIRVDHQAGIVSLFLNRPERRNALSLALLARLSEALSSEIREDTAAVIISGSDECFSAGADLADLMGTIDDLRMDDAIEQVTRKITDLPLPVIAAIDGPCMGGSFDLAISCDHRIASKSAFFQVPAAQLGLLYSPRAIVRMRHRIGRDGVFRLLVLGERLDAIAARRAGIVSHVVEGTSYDAAVRIAQACSGNIRAAVAATKQLLNAIEGTEYDPEEWEERRRHLLSSAERRMAVSKEKKRRGLSP